jgi:hypothetical protein
MAGNVGPDETVVLPRTSLSVTAIQASPNGPNSFSVVIPLPTKFFYNPSNGNLLMDAFVFDRVTTRNLDWDSGVGDGVSVALSGLSASLAGIISETAPVTQFVFEPVPEPATVGSLIFGFFIVAGVWRRKEPQFEV